MAINKELAEKQGLSEREVIAIEEVQKHLNTFLKCPTMYAKEEDAPEIVTAFEFVLQKLWNFPLDKKFHRYQNDLEGCTCEAKMDNQELIGVSEARWCTSDCPYHGY